MYKRQTEERAKTYAFTTPYGYIHTALAVRKDNEDIHTFEDLKGKTTANSLASTYMELAESYGATVQGIDTLEETIQLLTAGRIDATLNADVSFYDYLNVHPDADFKLVAQTAEASHVAIPVLKSEDTAVSYTHLDVYKRQGHRTGIGGGVGLLLTDMKLQGLKFKIGRASCRERV